MGLISNKIGRDELRHGDHIYTWRRGYSYSHHGIYVGYGNVIHLTRGPGLIFSSASQSSNDRVDCCNIEAFLCDGQLYRFEYGVSKILFVIKRAGTCSFASCNPPEDVLHRAFFLLGQQGFGNYHLFQKNCEDFAFYCKTGFLKDNNESLTSGSAQIMSLHAALAAVTIVPYPFVPFIVLPPVLYGLYSFFRLDLAVRVEKLDSLRRPEDRMEKSTRWYLGAWSYLIYTIYAINYWYWTPENTVLIWFKSFYLYGLLCSLVSDHLNLHHGFKLGEYSAYTILLLAYCYWRWRSVSTVILFTGLISLMSLLLSYISDHDHPRRLKINENIHKTIFILVLLYWTPGITILQWIKFAFLHFCLFILAVDYVRNNRALC